MPSAHFSDIQIRFRFLVIVPYRFQRKIEERSELDLPHEVLSHKNLLLESLHLGIRGRGPAYSFCVYNIVIVFNKRIN